MGMGVGWVDRKRRAGMKKPSKVKAKVLQGLPWGRSISPAENLGKQNNGEITNMKSVC